MPSGGNGIDVTLSRQDKWSPMETFVRVKSKLRVVLKDNISVNTIFAQLAFELRGRKVHGQFLFFNSGGLCAGQRAISLCLMHGKAAIVPSRNVATICMSVAPLFVVLFLPFERFK